MHKGKASHLKVQNPNENPICKHLRFKHVQCITHLLSRDKIKVLVGEYARRVMIPFLIKVNRFFNPILSHNTPKLQFVCILFL